MGIEINRDTQHDYKLYIREDANNKQQLAKNPLTKTFKDFMKDIRKYKNIKADSNETIIVTVLTLNILEPAPPKEMFIASGENVYRVVTSYRLQTSSTGSVRYTYVLESMYKFDDATLTKLYIIHEDSILDNINYNLIRNFINREKLVLQFKWNMKKAISANSISMNSISSWSVLTKPLKDYNSNIQNVFVDYDVNQLFIKFNFVAYDDEKYRPDERDRIERFFLYRQYQKIDILNYRKIHMTYQFR
jgi:hypothetical protein